MNASIKQHLVKAKDYLARGDEFYLLAKPEIDAALAEGASLREVSRFLDRSYQWVADVRDWDGKGTLYGKDTGRRQKDMAKQVLRESTPEQVAEILDEPEIQQNVAKAQGIRFAEQRQRSDEKFAEAVGIDVVDGLAAEQRLRDAEAKVFEARRALRDMLALLNDSDLESMRDSWREDFLKTLDDLAMRIDVARSLLGGSLDADLEQFLAEV